MIEETTTSRTGAVGLGQVGQLSRRAMLARAGGAAGVGLAAHLGASASATQNEKATFVLVPGSWAGGWIWGKVIPLLREAGHDAYAVTNTGVGDRVHLADPAINLDVYITDIVNLLEYEDLHDVVLVGHSFGGMVISGAAEQAPERLAQVVYLDASVPADGQSGYDYYGVTDEILGAIYNEGEAAGWPGFEIVGPGIEEWIRASVPDQADAEWLISKLVPQPLASATQPIAISNPAAAALPRAFILCTADKDLTADPQTDPLVLSADQARSDPNWTVLEIDANHIVLVDDPMLTAETLLSLV